MWLATKSGFFSIVKHRGKERTFIVRARVLKDIENAVKILRIGKKEIMESVGSDYKYRITVPLEGMLNLVLVLGQEINYPNFKDEIHRTPEQRDKLPAYSSLWSDLRFLQEQEVGV